MNSINFINSLFQYPPSVPIVVHDDAYDFVVVSNDSKSTCMNLLTDEVKEEEVKDDMEDFEVIWLENEECADDAVDEKREDDCDMEMSVLWENNSCKSNENDCSLNESLTFDFSPGIAEIEQIRKIFGNREDIIERYINAITDSRRRNMLKECLEMKYKK